MFNELSKTIKAALILQPARWRSMDKIGVCDSTGDYS